MLFMLSALFGGKMGLMKNKKGHFDLETLIVAISGGIIAYLVAQSRAIKSLFGNKNESKDKKTARFR